MPDYVFLSASDLERSIAFYSVALAPLGITNRVDHDHKGGAPGHPDLKGLCCKGRILLWMRPGVAEGRTAHVGFVATSAAWVDTGHAAAMTAGGTDNGAPGARLYYDPRYYAANSLGPHGYSLEFTCKDWQH